MPDPIRQALQAAKVRAPNTSRRQRREEPQWTEYSVLAYDGLMPTQIVLRMTDREGIDRWEATALPFRVDARADTDDRRNDKVPFLPADPMRYVDERRYVVDPMPGKHEVLGLWTGGPVRMTTDKRSGGIEVTRVLTRTFCAGHGYVTDKHGNYVAAFTEDGGTTFHDKDGHALDASKVREYLSADDALRFHRASLGSRLSPYMLLRNDFPAAYTREVQWREFTHESIKFLDPLGLKPENRPRLSAIVGEKFKELAGEAVTNAACRVDAETNTVIFTAALTYSKLGEPVDPSDLLALPCLETCDRDTLRMFGWGQLEDGEGYKYTHLFRWPRLKDTPEVRRALEFVKDNAPTRDVYAETEDGSDSDSDPESVLIAPAAPSFVVALLHQHGLLPAAGDTTPAWFGDGGSDSDADDLGPYEKRFGVVRRTDQLDHTGRLVTQATALSHAEDASTGGTTPSTASVPVQTYRIAKQRVEPDQDGSISFIVAVAKAEWHGGDDGENWETVKADGKHGSRILASVSAPQGYGRTETRTIVSVPRQNAIPTMNAIKAKGDYEIVVEKRQTEGGEGASDVSFRKRRLYDYMTHLPDDVVNIDGTVFNAPRYTFDPETNVYQLSYPQVRNEDVQTLVDHVRGLLGGEPRVSVQSDGAGSCTVSITGHALNPRHIAEWVVAADWYRHETLEQWLGVVVKTKGDDDGSDSDELLGFYSRYVRQTDPQTGVTTIEPDEASFVRVEAVRGDLDANWMGSDPQSPGANGGNAIVYYTIGIGESSKERLDDDLKPAHGDQHGSGWGSAGSGAAASWSDPDSGSDSDDKLRSHAIVRVRPRLNGDRTMDLSIERIYPHQRVWRWETEKNNGRKDGEWKTVYHAEYRNWPSRHAIKKDLVERFATEAGVDIDGDDYRYSFTPNVNEFGLVDAADVVLEPLFWNERKGRRSVAADEGEQDLSDYDFKEQTEKPGMGARIAPGSANHQPAFDALLGYYFCIVRTPFFRGAYDDEQTAWQKYAAHGIPGQGSSPPARGSDGLYHYVWASETKQEGKAWYNGMKPVVVPAGFNGQDIGSSTKEGKAGLSQATWKLWFDG